MAQSDSLWMWSRRHESDSVPFLDWVTESLHRQIRSSSQGTLTTVLLLQQQSLFCLLLLRFFFLPNNFLNPCPPVRDPVSRWWALVLKAAVYWLQGEDTAVKSLLAEAERMPRALHTLEWVESSHVVSFLMKYISLHIGHAATEKSFFIIFVLLVVITC